MFRSLKDFVENIIDYCPHCKKRKRHELVVTPVAVEDWGNCGNGRYFEDLAPQGMRFRDKRSFKDYLKRNQISEWSPKRGMPGCEV